MANNNKSNETQADVRPVQNRQAAIQIALGWWALAVFMIGGLGLEALHLFKTAAYFEMAIRRELWVLAHAHGALLAVINIAAGLCMRARELKAGWAIWSLRVALIFMPLGFFLGGINPSESDPSLWIILTPIGAICAIAASISLGKTFLRN